ncbi:MAG: hypothetical protein ACJAZ9_001973, partial [Neolewinella sp.]
TFWSLAKRKITCIAVATEVIFRDASGQKIKFWATKLTGWPTRVPNLTTRDVEVLDY